MLSINTLLQYTDSGDLTARVERILWIDVSYSSVVVIDVEARTALPEFRMVGEISDFMESGQLSILTTDSYSRIVSEETLTEKEKAIRDRAWAIVSTLAGTEREPGIFTKGLRGQWVEEASREFKVSPKTIMRYLRRFWQRGKCKNALLPDYDRSGGYGKERRSTTKVGRPRKYEDIVGVGVNVDEEMKRIFGIALNRFYLNNRGNTLRRAYELMRKEYFSDIQTDKSGESKKTLHPISEVPTLGQFKYHYYKERDWKQEVSSRRSKKHYLQNHRPLVGSSTLEALGPGSIFSIDASIADVYLVSRYNRDWVIGRPVIYFVIDNFSRMVAGMSVSLEGPSWVGAMVALANASENKVDFCARYGIEITEDDFPVHHLPESIVADQGEMASRFTEPLIELLNIKVMNTAPFRPDSKPIVERFFRTMNDSVKPLLPGSILPDFRERGARDYRLDATLDIYQFTQIVIKAVLYHNHKWMETYPRDVLMVQDDIDPVPVALWKWGIVNRAGRLRSYPEDYVRLCLLPTGEAAVTGRGIRFNKMYYSCEKALKERWFERARNRGTWKVSNVSYDPRNLNAIYIRLDDGREYVTCTLLPHQQWYFDKTEDEIRYLLEYEQTRNVKVSEVTAQSTADFVADVEEIVKQAKQQTRKERHVVIKPHRRIGEIRVHRRVEKQIRRHEDAAEWSERLNEERVAVVAEERGSDSQEEDVDLTLLRRKQKESRRSDN